MSDHKQTTSSNDYIFNRDDKSAIRLNYQHSLVTRLCGFLIHPAIPQGRPNLTIADVAAGSGLWATEVAEQFPNSTEMYAIDIFSDQFPAPHWMPNNVHLLAHDCFKPWPPTLLGKFDIVNVRFFVTCLAHDTMQAFLDNIKSLLKPGGYFQWFEPDMLSLRVTTGSLTLPTPALDRLIPIMQRPTPGSDHTWGGKLDKILSHADFAVTAIDRYPLKDSLKPMSNHTHIMAYEAISDKLEHEGQLEIVSQVRNHIGEVREEFREGAALDKVYVCCVARKKDESRPV